ncbi:uncharacterized protein LOC131857657 [Cryptomeria japonica]|uniref:uncharacterized protein LOC131857657 n=1 Tax=Cryptomeria japonica TaxID=3369 RepID=UPI0027DA2574|nr:uncharacterized protein LOC131857657 [Cryptomeria japonica]
MLGNNKRAWDSKIDLVVWEDWITTKKSIGKSPFELVYGKQEKLSLGNLLPVHRFIVDEEVEFLNPMEERLIQFLELDEIMREASKHNFKMQQQVKALHDKKYNDIKFKEGDWVLVWNARNQDKGKHDKFEALYIGPFVILDKGEDSYYL